MTDEVKIVEMTYVSFRGTPRRAFPTTPYHRLRRKSMADVTIYTLAEELNMTPSMVSRAFSPGGKINEEKRRRVLELAEKYNFSPNKLASRLSRRKIRIGILLRCRFQVNADKMLAGIEEAYGMLKDYKIEYDITVINPVADKSCNYEEILEKYSDYDGIIISGFSSEKHTDVIDRIYKKNPNIVQVQAINAEANCLFASKHNEQTASYMAAEFLHNCLKRSEGKNVLLFTGDCESALHKAAAAHFENACRDFGLNLIETVDMKDDEEYLKQILPQVFRRCGEVDGIYITSGISDALCGYLDKNRKDAFLVTFDTHAEIKKYMEKGVVSATIEQNVSNQMCTAFKGLVRYIIDGEKSPETVYTDIQLVLKSNMNQF